MSVDPTRERTQRAALNAGRPWGLEGAGPWTPPAGSPVFDDGDPTDLPHTVPFFGYSVAANGLSITIYSPPYGEDMVVYVAQEHDAVHVVLRERPEPLPDGVHRGSALLEAPVTETLVKLERPLGGRPIIDATRGQRAKRLDSCPGEAELEQLRDTSVSNPL